MKTEIVDYAMPLMMIERMAKQIHDRCLEHRYEDAGELVLKLLAETRVLQHTLAIMQERPWNIPSNSLSETASTPSN